MLQHSDLVDLSHRGPHPSLGAQPVQLIFQEAIFGSSRKFHLGYQVSNQASSVGGDQIGEIKE